MGLGAFLLVLLVTTMALPAIGAASEFRSGNTVKLGSTEQITGDTYVAARAFTLDGSISGDLTVVAANARIRGSVDGTLTLLAGRATIAANIGGSVRVGGGKVTVTGNVAGDLVVAGGQVEITQGARIEGDLIAAAGTVDVRGTVNGDARGISSNATFSGTVSGDVSIETSRLTVEGATRINGGLDYSSANDADIDGNAQVRNGIEQSGKVPWAAGDRGPSLFSPVLRVVWALIAGTLMIAIAPRFAAATARHGSGILQSIGVGILAVLALPVVIVLLTVTIIGIPAALIVIGIFVIALYLSLVLAGMSLGRLILPDRWNDGSRGYHLLAMVLGVILLSIVDYVPLPFIGLVVTVVVTLWGLGAAFSVLPHLANRRASSS